MITQTVYMDADHLDSLVNYLDKERGLESRHGEELSESEKQQFIDRGAHRDICRMLTFSPENGEELSDEELSRSTRRVMRELIQDRPTASYCYGIHRDTDNPHTQLAITGSKDDLWMDVDDLEELREEAQEAFPEPAKAQENEQEQEQEAEGEEDVLVQETLDGRSVDDVADEHIARVQHRLPSNDQFAEQASFEEVLGLDVDDGEEVEAEQGDEVVLDGGVER